MSDDEIGEFSTRVQIDKLHVAAGALAAFFLVIGIYIAFAARGAGSMGFMIGIFGVVGLVYAVIGIGNAPCPECGFMRSVTFLKENGSGECKGCGAYFHTKGGQSILTKDDAIEEFPAFGTACPKNIEWPPGCCVCEQEVTRTVPVVLELEEDAPAAQDMLARAATLGTFKLVSKRKFEVQIPVCDAHGEDSAELEYRYEEEQLHIKFRSRRYMVAFAETNGPVFWDS